MILDRFRVTGQAAVVTGAGRGIGAATAIALAQAGADVLISARTEDQLAKVAREIETAGRRAVVVPADLSDLDAAAGLARAAAEAFGRLDIGVKTSAARCRGRSWRRSRITWRTRSSSMSGSRTG
jgi:7-alpha-hydroxysteroid dehydrogenase